MGFKALATVCAVALFVAYYLPIVLKLKDVPLSLIVIGGIALAAVDAWHTFTDKDG